MQSGLVELSKSVILSILYCITNNDWWWYLLASNCDHVTAIYCLTVSNSCSYWQAVMLCCQRWLLW